jgi:hypothetical protein
MEKKQEEKKTMVTLKVHDMTVGVKTTSEKEVPNGKVYK